MQLEDRAPPTERRPPRPRSIRAVAADRRGPGRDCGLGVRGPSLFAHPGLLGGVDRVGDVQTATSGRGAQIRVRAGEQVRTHLQCGTEVDSVVAAKTLLLCRIGGLVHQPCGGLHDRDLLPQPDKLDVGTAPVRE